MKTKETCTAQSSANEFHRKRHELGQENLQELVGFKGTKRSKQPSECLKRGVHCTKSKDHIEFKDN